MGDLYSTHVNNEKRNIVTGKSEGKHHLEDLDTYGSGSLILKWIFGL